MGISAAVLAASVVAAGAGAIASNQQTQHAKGAAQAQETAMNAQLTDAKKTDDATTKSKADQGSATQAAALAALRASMSPSTQAGGSILTSGTGTGAPAPTATKTLLGV